MDKIMVAVGSLREPKIGAVRDALRAISPRLGVGADFEIVGVDADSGVRRTPLTREETMVGARNRAEQMHRTAREEDKPWRFLVGLEGGIEVVRENGALWTFLQNWAYVSDETGRGSFGQSGAILLPESLAKSVVDDGVELADAIDAYAGLAGVRNAQGAWAY